MEKKLPAFSRTCFVLFPLELRHLAQEIQDGILYVCHEQLLDFACNSAFILLSVFVSHRCLFSFVLFFPNSFILRASAIKLHLLHELCVFG